MGLRKHRATRAARVGKIVDDDHDSLELTDLGRNPRLGWDQSEWVAAALIRSRATAVRVWSAGEAHGSDCPSSRGNVSFERLSTRPIDYEPTLN